MQDRKSDAYRNSDSEQLTRRIRHTSKRTKIRETTIIREGFLCISNCIGRNTEGTQISWKISSERYTAKTYLRWTSDVSREACMYAGEGSAAVHPSSSTRWRGVRGECVGGTACRREEGGPLHTFVINQVEGGGCRGSALGGMHSCGSRGGHCTQSS